MEVIKTRVIEQKTKKKKTIEKHLQLQEHEEHNDLFDHNVYGDHAKEE